MPFLAIGKPIDKFITLYMKMVYSYIITTNRESNTVFIFIAKLLAIIIISFKKVTIMSYIGIYTLASNFK